jgi:cytochrome c biogenesis protein
VVSDTRLDTGPTGPDTTFSEDVSPAGQLPDGPAPLAPLEFARWIWRQLTSMRTALVLLFLLALAAIPGSLYPQRPENPSTVLDYIQTHPATAPLLEKLGLFDVFHSAWFAAIYLLLFVSLIGCVIPRSRVHLRAARSRPTLTPRNLLRLEDSASWVTDTPAAEVLAAARSTLGRRHRHRLSRATDPLAPVAAERGHLRETGNLVFHLSLIVMLIGLAWSSLGGYKITAIVVEGTGFADVATLYDDSSFGPLVDKAALPPFSFVLKKFTSTFALTGDQAGQPTTFDATLSLRRTPTASPQTVHLELDHPVKTGGAQVSLEANGYAPIFRVTDGGGKVVYDGPTVFLPTDGDYTSTGVVKIPDAQPRQLAISGTFLPTASPDFADSVFPAPNNPELRVTFYTGDLGLDDGFAQSIYTLDTAALTQLKTPTGQPFTASMKPGKSITLPGGNGTVTFLGYKRWINVQVARSPGTPIVLVAATLAVLGLCGSLFVRRRRFWVRATADGAGRTVVEVAGLDRTRDPDVRHEVDSLVVSLQSVAPVAAPPTGEHAGATRSAPPAREKPL